ncbi:MAG: alkaline phosphatase, partial [Candidatus Kryptonium sp.]
MKRIKIFYLLLLLIFTLDIYAQQIVKPKNIILMIGDGMGLAQISAGKTYKGQLNLEKMKIIGLLTTHSCDEYITDSGAGATAMSTGYKTKNVAIGVDCNGERRETVLEYANKIGKSTGIVVVCAITHATPAAFVAHVPDRNMQFEIAEQIAKEANADIYLGSGWGWFLPKSEGGRRTDGQNLIDTLKKRGYFYISNSEEFYNLDLKKVNKLIGLFAENHPTYVPDRKPTLAEMTKKAIEFLSRDKDGFFLMVEGSQIDWAGHDNNSEQILKEMADFDEAIGVALDFAQKDGKTLVIVRADHETGGYALVGGSVNERKVEGKFATKNHTGI